MNNMFGGDVNSHGKMQTKTYTNQKYIMSSYVSAIAYQPAKNA